MKKIPGRPDRLWSWRGGEGFASLAKILEASVTKNKEPILINILNSLPLPDPEKVPVIPLHIHC